MLDAGGNALGECWHSGHLISMEVVQDVVLSEDCGRHGPVIIRQLDRSLKVTAVRPGVDFRSRHKQLEAEGKLQHALTDQEVEQLKSGTVVIR